MSNHWLRLWHEMPNDPKWRTIARASAQPLALVQAMYIHLLVDASRNVTRGHISVTLEDLASALDCDTEQVEKIYAAMQGRVLKENELTGWSARQPVREDLGNSKTGAKSAAARKREQRERERKKEALEGENVTNVTDVTENVTSHEMSRNGHDSVTDKRDINNDKKAKNCSQTLESKGLSRMSRNVTTDTDTDTEYNSLSLSERAERETIAAAPKAQAESSVSPVADLRRFQMPDDWQPDPDQLKTLLRTQTSVKPEDITGELIDKYRLHCVGAGKYENSRGWHAGLIRWAINERKAARVVPMRRALGDGYSPHCQQCQQDMNDCVCWSKDIDKDIF